MILYVNGDSHTAAAEAVNPHAFAMDDGNLFYMGRAPHPDNLAVSWAKQLSSTIKCGLHCQAESASSNARILRTARAWLTENYQYLSEVLMIIQWSTWEREEWLIDDIYYQINASGTDDIPASYQQQYKEYIVGVDWAKKTQQAHEDIWQFHTELQALGVKHIFFNGNNDFSKIPVLDQKSWDTCYVAPYDPAMTFDYVIRKQGIQTVAPNSWHYGREGHSFFHRFMLQYILANKLI